MLVFVRRFLKHDRGSMATLFAMSVVPIAGFTGLALDYSRVSSARSSLQGSADSAVIAAVRARVPTGEQRVKIANDVFDASNAGKLAAQVTSSGNSGAFTVAANAAVDTPLLSLFQVHSVGVTVKSTARKVFEGPPVCILALNPSVSGAVTITGNASFVGDGCAIHSNSAHHSGLVLDGNTPPQAASYCSVGGVSTIHKLTPEPLRYCEPVLDPFAKVTAPSGIHCDANNFEVSPKQNKTLSPGTYCGGLTIKGTAVLKPGTYVIRNGPFTIASQASVKGDGVTFSLVGSNAGFSFSGGAIIQLSAPDKKPYGGVLIIQDKSSNPGAENALAGGSGSSLVGTVYTPSQKVTITGGSGFGQEVPLLAVIADQVRISGTTVARTDVTGIEMAAPLPRMESGVRLVY